MGDCCNSCDGKHTSSKWSVFTDRVVYEFKHFIPRMIERMQDRILRWAIHYIKWHAVNICHSNMIKHAQTEFDIAFREYWKPKPGDPIDNDDDDMQHYMCDQIIELLALLSSQGDSGSSIGYKMNMFKKCVNFDIITPLTFKDDEFGKADLLHHTLQNKRKSSIFKESDGSITYLYGMTKHGMYYIGDENKVTVRDSPCRFHGKIFVVRSDKSIYQVDCSVKLKHLPTTDFKTFDIPIYEIEYPNGWWIGLTKESELDKVKEVYDIIESNSSFEEELNFKDGKYRDEILARVNTVINHMYVFEQ